MSEFSNALQVTTSGLRLQAGRLRLIAENIANIDTPGYHRKTAQVRTEPAEAGGLQPVALGRVQLDDTPLERVFDPAHPMADATGHYDSSNVDIIVEIADAREAQRSYEANLKVFDQTRQMSSSLMDLLRR